MTGYWMDKGYTPEYLASLTREDKIMFAAVAKLNQEEQQEMFKNAVIDVAAFIMKKVKG